ncbi:monofunctional biosynthetic peptidoglycan transglycosylase [Rhodoplanes elegans]|uniref:Biosynthetic peptidoglycan transglycosylase n=2 Tax=Rhodoplanes elegans TaxID=29408 RepID=A0A327KJZ0_9BRAD|nr:monofunctional biosynthetic peptidoglycan transglycosylase [Rhodoplanes elegans]MBK5960114.1 monofunctional biosynthetic peptidoglycan transglycosylase [Rhodoplanes elegans]RAI38434.1 monofunctional biosynthetic peptidoglycan transglycosylase [Rhodoplanes elegans]
MSPTIAPRRWLARPAGWRGWLMLAVVVVLVLLLLPYVLTPFLHFGRPVSTLMLGRWLTGQRVERVWVPLADIAPVLPRTVIVAEDARFCGHRGVDLAEIRDAIEDDGLLGARGASTISQQLAKNVFLWPGRSFVRKALEAPLAVWMDLVLGKRRVMELYLNVAEWGPDGEFGAEAGARRAFGRSARDLSAGQAALMAAMLPDPHRRNAAKPGPGLRRLAGIHERRAAKALAACVVARR